MSKYLEFLVNTWKTNSNPKTLVVLFCLTSSVQDVVPSSSEFTDSDQLNTPHLNLQDEPQTYIVAKPCNFNDT